MKSKGTLRLSLVPGVILGAAMTLAEHPSPDVPFAAWLLTAWVMNSGLVFVVCWLVLGAGAWAVKGFSK
jgi:hypothetical protein